MEHKTARGGNEKSGKQEVEKEEGRVKAQIDTDSANTGTKTTESAAKLRGLRHMLFTKNIQYASVNEKKSMMHHFLPEH